MQYCQKVMLSYKEDTQKLLTNVIFFKGESVSVYIVIFMKYIYTVQLILPNQDA